MALPLVDRDQIIATLLATIPKTNPRIEVSGVYPSDDSVTGYGIYVSESFAPFPPSDTTTSNPISSSSRSAR